MNALQKAEQVEMERGRGLWLRRRVLRRIRSLETDRSILQLAVFGPIIFLKGMLEPWRQKGGKSKNNGGPR